MKTFKSAVACLWIGLASAVGWSAQAQGLEIGTQSLTVRVTPDGGVTLQAKEVGAFLTDGRFCWLTGQNAEPLAIDSVKVQGPGLVIRARAGQQPLTLELTLMSKDRDTALVVTVKPAAPAGTLIALKGHASWGTAPMLCRLWPEKDAQVCQLATGPTASDRLNALFDAAGDRALFLDGDRQTLEPIERAKPSAGFTALCAGRSSFRMGIRRGVYTGQGIAFYKPIDRSAFAAPPAGWCSWYYYYGRIDEQEMHKNTDWMAKNLKPFGAEYIQLDDGYQTASWTQWNAKFPHGPAGLAAYIRSKGMKPGLWLTPFATDQADLLQAHPDWFLRDAQGRPVPTFKKKYTLDATNPQALTGWFEPLFETLGKTDGFDYFKIDGQPTVVDAYRRNAARFYAARKEGKTVAPEQAYRAGLAAIRRAVGDKRFILSCWGIATQGVGITNASRTGGDVSASWGGMGPARAATQRWLFLNNICWITDPDVVCVRPPLTLNQARAWASLVALTGQLLMASDKMYALPADRVEILRRVYPVCYMRPADLYPLQPSQLKTIDLRVERPFAHWDVVGLFNWRRGPAMLELSPAKLGLPDGAKQRYVGYDFWSKKLLPPFTGPVRLALPGTACRVIALHRALDRPELVSTSRHVTQGAVDLDALSWDAKAKSLEGVSRVVGGDPYELDIFLPQQPRAWKLKSVETKVRLAQASDEPGLRAEVRQDGPLARIVIHSDTSRPVSWSAEFKVGPAPPATPAAVSGLKARAVSPRQVALSWTGPSGVWYRVRRGGGRAVSVLEPEFTDDDLAGDTQYAYTVCAVDSQGKESAAETVRVKTPPLPPPPPAPDVSLADLKPIKATVGWGNRPKMNRSIESHPMRIAGKAYAAGVGVHADSELVYPVQANYARFVAKAGVDDEVNGNPGSVTFSVFADKTLLYESPTVRAGEPAVNIDVAIPAGTKQIRLIVGDAGDGIGYDHADWADAGFLLAGKPK